MRDNRTTIIVILGVLVIFGVAVFVVFSGNKTNATEQTAQFDKEMAAADTQVTDETITEVISTEDTSVEENVPTAEEVIMPTVKKDLEATDPGTVNLASGDVQLIEFFAFW